MKRLLCCILAIAVSLTVLPKIASATDEVGFYSVELEGTGTSTDPYLIYDADDLKEFRDRVNGGEYSACARLEDDIVINSGEFTADADGGPLYNGDSILEGDAEEWTPIGIPEGIDFSAGWYQGVFDGNFHVISGIYCDYPESVSFFGMSAGGLFCALGSSGTIKNVGIENSYIRGQGAGSIVVGSQGKITGCYSAAYVVGLPPNETGYSAAGGISAVVIAGAVRNNLFTGTVKGASGFMGGIVGLNGLTTPINYPSTATYSSNYFITTSGKYLNGCTQVTAEKLLSGETAYKLNQKLLSTEWVEPFGQTVGVEYPYFGGAAVYKVVGCDGKDAYSNTNENIEHNYDKNNGFKCTYCASVPVAVSMIQETEVFYEDIGEAFADVEGWTAVLTLYQDAELEDTVVLSSGSVTIELNGHRLATEKEAAICLNGASVTIQDSSTDGTGAIVSTSSSSSGVEGTITMTQGALTVTSGTIQSENGIALLSSDGTVTISGGVFTGKSGEYAVQLPVETVLSGGKFSSLYCEIDLIEVVSSGYAVKCVDTGSWDAEMLRSAYAEEVQIKQIPFRVTEKPAAQGAYEGYSAEESPVLSVGVEGTDVSYQWYQLIDGMETIIPDATASSYAIPVDLVAGDYLYRWRVEADGYWETGEVSFKVIALGEDPVDPENPTTQPTNPGTTELPTAPSMSEEVIVNIYDPVIGEGIAASKIYGQYIFLDVDPLYGLTLGELKESFSNPELVGWDYDYSIQNSVAGDNDKVKTSDRLVITVRNSNGEDSATKTYILVVMGDANGDGMALSNDAVLMMRAYYNAASVSDEVWLAMDMDQDGMLGANDARRLIYKYYNWDGDYSSVLG